MSDYRQQQECEERDRWFAENMDKIDRGLARMDELVRRGSAMQQILEVEANDRNNSRTRTDQHGEAESKGERELVFPQP